MLMVVSSCCFAGIKGGHVDGCKGIPVRCGRLFKPLGILFATVRLAFAAQTNAPDAWITNQVIYPAPAGGITPARAPFAELHAEGVAGRLKIVWPTSANVDSVTLSFSADDPGHWPARDWRHLPMDRRGNALQAVVPLDSVDVPVAYCVTATSAGSTNVSPMRLCRPRLLEVTEPSRYFWPFIEGFEQGIEGWQLVTRGGRLEASPEARNGKAALRVVIPKGGRRAAVGTTRVRGWSIQEHGATGIAFWAAARRGRGEVRVTMRANAHTPDQVAVTQTNTTALGTNWQRVAILFSAFPEFPRESLDWIEFEVTGPASAEVLLDDLHLLGRWRFD